MILPLGDSPNPRGVPFVTYALIAANIAVYLLISVPLSSTAANPHDPLLREYTQVIREHAPPGVSTRQLLQEVTAYDLFIYRYGFRPAAPHIGALFASLFLHAGLMHLIGNMLFLWIYGDNVEDRLGHGRYLMAYVGTGAAATLFYMVLDPRSLLPLVGASGAISGVLGFYFLWFPHNQVRLLLLFFPFLFNTITVSARLLLGMYIIADNLIPLLLTRGAGGGVAYGAHIGGFIGGLAIAWLTDRRQLRARPPEYAGAAGVSAQPADLEQTVRAGLLSEAATRYFALSPTQAEGALSPESLLQLADWLRSNGHDQAALIAYRRHLRDYPNDATAADAHLGAGLVQLDALGQPTAAYQHFLDALELSPSEDVAARARAALDSITARQRSPWRPAAGRGSR